MNTYKQSDRKPNTILSLYNEYIASKIQTDLMRFHRYYYHEIGFPNLNDIRKYHKELVILQKHDLFSEIKYGFVHENKWIKAFHYVAGSGFLYIVDADPGGISFDELPEGVEFSSELTYSNIWTKNCEGNIMRNRHGVERTESEKDYEGEFDHTGRTYSTMANGVHRYDIGNNIKFEHGYNQHMVSHSI